MPTLDKLESLGLILSLNCGQIRPFKEQPRKNFDKNKLEELAGSIEAGGQQIPIIVRQLPKGETHEYELVDGERRLMACKSLGIKIIAWVNNIEDNNRQYMASVMANIPHERLNDLEIMNAILKIRKDFNLTQLETSKIIGKSISYIQQHESLANLVPEVQKLMSHEIPEKQRLPYSQALILATADRKYQLAYAKAAVNHHWNVKQVKHILESEVGRKNLTNTAPRKNREIFNNFLKRTKIDLFLILEQKDRFDAMFKDQSTEEIDKILKSLSDVIENMKILEKYINNFKSKDGIKK